MSAIAEALFPPELSQRTLARGIFSDPMNSVVITTYWSRASSPFCCFLVFTYLHEQSRQPYFRAWQLAWAAYSLHYVLDTFPAFFGCVLCQRAVPGGDGVVHFRFDAPDARPFAVPLVRRCGGSGGGGAGLLTLRGHIVNGVFRPDVQPPIQPGVGPGGNSAVLLGGILC